MNTQRFFRCNVCGNLVGMINNAGVPMVCCGEKMGELIPNTVDASAEKHVPKIEVSGRLVYIEIGSVIHPSEEAHHIDFIYLQTKNGGQRKTITVGDKPAAMFAVLEDDEALEAFAYCNLHGLWKASVACGCGCGETPCDCGEASCDCGEASCDCGEASCDCGEASCDCK